LRTPTRRSSIVRAVDLRDRRQRLGLTTNRMADYLEVADCKHVSAIEIGRASITMEKAIRSAYVLGAVTVELPGLGRAAVIPVREADSRKTHLARHHEPLRPGEAAWIALTENREAIDSLESLQAAVTLRDRPALVALYEQIVCDPRHAAELVAEAIDRLDPTISPEAAINHATKLMRRGVLAANSPPLDAA
jgi:transcriptional regulator with XRE-family HTH domain